MRDDDDDITQEDFDFLLAWLDPDREQAGLKYEHIRLCLIKIFTNRGCYEAELVADATMIVVTKKVREVAPGYVGDPALYFYAVGKRKLWEWFRNQSRPLPPPPEPPDDVEHEYECLEHCMNMLPTSNRELVLEYYKGDKRAKIENRSNLAQSRGIGLNALRIRVLRIKKSLRECFLECLQQELAV